MATMDTVVINRIEEEEVVPASEEEVVVVVTFSNNETHGSRTKDKKETHLTLHAFVATSLDTTRMIVLTSYLNCKKLLRRRPMIRMRLMN